MLTGVSVTYSKTALIVLVPPSITKHTTGVLEWVTAKLENLIYFHAYYHYFMVARQVV